MVRFTQAQLWIVIRPKILDFVICVKWGMCLCGLQTVPLGMINSINIPCHGIFGGIFNLCATNNGGLLHCIKPKLCFVHKKHLKQVVEWLYLFGINKFWPAEGVSVGGILGPTGLWVKTHHEEQKHTQGLMPLLLQKSRKWPQKLLDSGIVTITLTR